MEYLSELPDVLFKTLKHVKKAYVGEHLDDLQKAITLYDTIDLDEDGYEEQIYKVLEYLSSITPDNKTYLWALACYKKAECFFDLHRFEQVRKLISSILDLPIDSFTINKDFILKVKEASRSLLVACIHAEYLLAMPEQPDDNVIDISRRLSKLLEESFSRPGTFISGALSFHQIGVWSWEIPYFFDDIEEEFGVSIDYESILGVSREEIEDSIEDIEYDDVDIIDLIVLIKHELYPDSNPNEDSSEEDYDNDNKLHDLIIGIIGEQLGINEDDINEWDSFTDLGADALDLGKIIRCIEKEISLRIPDEALEENGVLEGGSLSLPDDFFVENLIDIVIDALVQTRDEDATLSEKEQEYMEMFKEYADAGQLSERNLNTLDKYRVLCGISEVRARELEASCSKPQLNEDEQDYLELYKKYAADGEISELDRKMLNKMRDLMGISEERAKVIEGI